MKIFNSLFFSLVISQLNCTGGPTTPQTSQPTTIHTQPVQITDPSYEVFIQDLDNKYKQNGNQQKIELENYFKNKRNSILFGQLLQEKQNQYYQDCFLSGELQSDSLTEKYVGKFFKGSLYEISTDNYQFSVLQFKHSDSEGDISIIQEQIKNSNLVRYASNYVEKLPKLGCFISIDEAQSFYIQVIYEKIIATFRQENIMEVNQYQQYQWYLKKIQQQIYNGIKNNFYKKFKVLFNQTSQLNFYMISPQNVGLVETPKYNKNEKGWDFFFIKFAHQHLSQIDIGASIYQHPSFRQNFSQNVSQIALNLKNFTYSLCLTYFIIKLQLFLNFQQNDYFQNIISEFNSILSYDIDIQVSEIEKFIFQKFLQQKNSNTQQQQIDAQDDDINQQILQKFSQFKQNNISSNNQNVLQQAKDIFSFCKQLNISNIDCIMYISLQEDLGKIPIPQVIYKAIQIVETPWKFGFKNLMI